MEKDKKISVEEWTSRFRSIGVDDDMMGHWHTLFERENPSGHQSFLEWLGLPEERIALVRSKSGESKKLSPRLTPLPPAGPGSDPASGTAC